MYIIYFIRHFFDICRLSTLDFLLSTLDTWLLATLDLTLSSFDEHVMDLSDIIRFESTQEDVKTKPKCVYFSHLTP